MKSKLIRFFNRAAVTVLLSQMLALPVSAHHSSSGYDMKKTETAQATIKEFRWSAPHSSAVFIIKGPKGQPQELFAHSATPSMFLKQGFKPKDFKVGDKVEIAWHPTRSGAPAGILSSIKFADGRVFKDDEFKQPGNLELTEAADRAKEQ
jgi:hypothetical protein